MPTRIPVLAVDDELIDSIKKIADAIDATNLTDKAVVVLLQEAIGAKYITRDQIRYVLNHIPRLQKLYIKGGK